MLRNKSPTSPTPSSNLFSFQGERLKETIEENRQLFLDFGIAGHAISFLIFANAFLTAS